MTINLFRPILAILILFIPLYPKFPLLSVQNTYVAIRLDDLVVAATLIIWLIYQLRHHFPTLKLPITRLFLVYFFAITASTLTAILIYQTEPVNILLLNLFRRFQYISLFFITLTAINTKKDLRFPFSFLLIASILVSIYGLGQKYLHFPVISTMNAEFSKGQLLEMNIWTRVSSTFAGHYDLAAFYSVALTLTLGVTLLVKNQKIRLLLLLVWLLNFYLLTLTASRISIFAFWGGACLVLFLLRKYFWIIPISLLVIFSFFSSKDLNQRLLATIPNIRFPTRPTSILPSPVPQPTLPRQSPAPGGTAAGPIPTVIRHGPLEETLPLDIDAGVARSGEIRFNVEWPRAITAWRKNPFTGTGLGSITLATDNDYLRLLGESGLLGFVSFFAIIAFFVFQTLKSKTAANLIFLGCLLTFLANALFIDVLEASKTAYLFWILMGVYHQSLLFSVKKHA